MSKRAKPDGVSDKVWAAFEGLADLEGYGTETDDWNDWFDCWYNGFCVGRDLKEDPNG